MDVKGDRDRYGAMAAALHWATAVGVAIVAPVGFFAARSGDPATTAFLLRLHVPIGIFVLACTIGRLAWRPFDRRPAPVPGPRWQARTAWTVDAALYVLLASTGLSGAGLLAVSGAGPALFCGAGAPLPRFADLAPMVPHASGAAALAVLLTLHVGAALHHQFVRRDGLLSRMSIRPGRR